jgi:hypothetical protein
VPQTAQTTTPEELSGPDGDATIEDIVRNMNATVEMVLTHGTDAVTTRGRDSQTAISPFTNSEQGAAGLANVVALPPARPPRKPSVTFHALQEWEGYVTEIGHKDFTANLLDLTAGETYAGEEAVIPLVEIWEADAAKMQVGSIFRWVIGYQRSVVGTKERVSRIVFRDLPAFTKNEIQAAEEWAETTKAVFEE